MNWFEPSRTNGDLKVTRCGNTACSSGNTTNAVDSTGNVGQYTAMVLDGTGLPIISYYDGAHLKVAHCGNVSCSSGNTITTVDSGTNVGQYTAIILDNTGLPIIATTTSAEEISSPALWEHVLFERKHD